MQNVVGPTLVAMAMKFALGAEIQSPTGLYVCSFIYIRVTAAPTGRWLASMCAGAVASLVPSRGMRSMSIF